METRFSPDPDTIAFARIRVSYLYTQEVLELESVWKNPFCVLDLRNTFLEIILDKQSLPLMVEKLYHKDIPFLLL